MLTSLKKNYNKLLSMFLMLKQQNLELASLQAEISQIKNSVTTADIARPSFDYTWQRYTLYAHAMGAVDGIEYTNSKEAFLQNYTQGCRVFETDVSLTAEGIPVLVHDWRQIDGDEFIPYQQALKKPLCRPMGYTQFMGSRFNGRYTPLDLAALVRLAKKHSDAYFIISIKSDGYRYDTSVRMRLAFLQHLCAEAGGDVWRRMIPQVHSPIYFERLIRDFEVSSVLYGMRSQIQVPNEGLEQFLKRNGIQAVACDHNKFFTTEDVFDAVHAAGASVIVATVNHLEERDRFVTMGADAFLTDYGFLESEWHNGTGKI